MLVASCNMYGIMVVIRGYDLFPLSAVLGFYVIIKILGNEMQKNDGKTFSTGEKIKKVSLKGKK